MNKNNASNYREWSGEKLRRKADQEWDMAGLARQDRDDNAERKHTANALTYEGELRRRYRS